MSLTALLFAAAAAPAPASLTLGQPRTLQGVRIMAVAPAPTGSKIAVTLENGEVRIFDASTGMALRKIAWNQPAYGLAWNAKGTQLVVGDESGRITFWNAANGLKIKEIRPHTKGVQAIFFNADGSRVMSTGKDDTVKVIAVATGKVEQNILGKGANLYSATYVPGGYAVGTLGFCPQVRKGSAVYRLEGFSDKSAFDMDYNKAANRVLAAGRDGTAMVFSIVGAKLGTLKGHQDWVQHCRFSPNGKFAVTSSTDRTVRVFSLATNQCVATFDNESTIGSPVCFTSDGKYLVSADVNDFLQIRSVTPPQGAVGRKRK